MCFHVHQLWIGLFCVQQRSHFGEKILYEFRLRSYVHEIRLRFCQLSVTQELRQADLDRLWNPLLFIDNILSESKEATWLTATVNHKGEAYVMERRRVRGIFMENLELDDFPLDVQVQLQFSILIFHCNQTH